MNKTIDHNPFQERSVAQFSNHHKIQRNNFVQGGKSKTGENQHKVLVKQHSVQGFKTQSYVSSQSNKRPGEKENSSQSQIWQPNFKKQCNSLINQRPPTTGGPSTSRGERHSFKRPFGLGNRTSSIGCLGQFECDRKSKQLDKKLSQTQLIMPKSTKNQKADHSKTQSIVVGLSKNPSKNRFFANKKHV